MAWWQKRVVFPVKRAWLAVSVRIKSPKDDWGILKLHDDVQMCGYEDVQVMWEMLRRSSEMDVLAKQQRQQHRKRPFWRLSSFSSSSSSTSTSTSNNNTSTPRKATSSSCNHHLPTYNYFHN